MFLCALIIISLILYIFFDLNYFIRIGFTIAYSRLFQKKKNVFDDAVIYGLCTTQDVDIFFRHMNNARYIRDLDFARFQYYDNCGIYKEIIKRKGHALQGASNIRYRRTIPIFNFYKIQTRLVYWDDKSIYLEQQFITLGDNFVRAIALSKQNIINVTPDELVRSIAGDKYKKLEKPAELTQWLESIETSSAKLRKKD